jgi:ribosomal protein S18 acetylase RimI-like enzyme
LAKGILINLLWQLAGWRARKSLNVNNSLTLRLMRLSDLPFADSIRELIGWNQTMNDWQRLLACQSDGCFIAEWDGTPAGTATTTCYGTELAWIGMVLVHPQFRRRGIGKALLERCLSYLSQLGVRCIKLDATPLGKPLYEQLGFCEEWSLNRWQANPFRAADSNLAAVSPKGEEHSARQRGSSDIKGAVRDSMAPESTLLAWNDSDAARAIRLDHETFGVDREGMLNSLAAKSCSVLVNAAQSGEIRGYGMLRAGAKAYYLGPIVARSPAAAFELITALLHQASGQSIYWDIPDSNASAIQIAKEFGFVPQRPLLRMFLGRNDRPGNRAQYFGIADPAIG